ncbi:bystin-like [Symsagittifera roscoffensis]|uniref:bystin-like n=1 Tax=Symsagittifera roscoffensis TaxID=84072 RepID=UPI00307BA1D7
MVKKRPSSTRSHHSLPLDEEVEQSRLAKQKKTSGQSVIMNVSQDDESSVVVDDRTSKKILSIAKKQQDEIGMELGYAEVAKRKQFSLSGSGESGVRSEEMHEELQENEDDPDDENADLKDEMILESERKLWDGTDLNAEDVTEEEEKVMKEFMKMTPQGEGKSQAKTVIFSNQESIYDKYMEALALKRAEVDDAVSQSQTADTSSPQLDERIIAVYKGVGEVMSKYRSGKIPKAFKVLPVLLDWEPLLFLTKPHQWTAAAMYQATRRFSASANEKIAQRFYNLVLLPRVRDDIQEYKKLNFFLYMALKKALFKIGAFFKGFLLPLCEEGDCTLREAVIISSILAKCSIPVLHSSAAMLKIAEMQWNGANSIFLKTFFNKKYALPFRVIDASVHHFLSFKDDQRNFPVLWHQCFLTFVQRYKNSLSNEQKEQLMRLAQRQYHAHITPMVQRELQVSINKFPENYTQKEADDENMSEASTMN